MHWKIGRYLLDLADPKIMGIVNITPDSFSDGGRYLDSKDALTHCENLLLAGADILDLGAESTRPGALPISQEEELARLTPILQEAVNFGVPISIDTIRPMVMKVALDMGADIINDVSSLRTPDATGSWHADQVIATHPSCGICLMHMHRDPTDMQIHHMKGKVTIQVRDFLHQQAERLLNLNVEKSRICLDPGIGFGKTLEQNFELLSNLKQLQMDQSEPYPMLLGFSRKASLRATIEKITPATTVLSMADFMVASTTAAILGIQNGAHIVRVHDVRETKQAVAIYNAMIAEK
jgi:dihydropteroate synthase